jgi:cytosine/adenosine deaminase-related metal-dependent hydrolase
MPRFYFDIIEGDSILRDEEGQICPDDEATEAEAIRTVSEMVKHGIGRLVDFERTVEVRDESAESLVRVRAVVKLEIRRFK